MGISGLLPLLKDIQTSVHVKDYAGQTLGIDAYVWLHRGACGCAKELAMGEATSKYVNYAMHRIRMLKYFGVKPYVVFDGDRLPSKQGTEDERQRRRDESLAKAKSLLAQGKASQAREYFAKCIDITPEMAYQLIKALKQEDVPFIVAPYEADAQLAYLEKKGMIDGIVTEDSDMLVLGCKKVLFKLDSNGDCIEILQSRFAAVRELPMVGWTEREFRQMAILSGCDYLGSIVGMGLKTAHKLLRKWKTVEKVVQQIRYEGQMKVPRDYLERFRRAELTFLYQRVFDPDIGELVTLNALPEEGFDDDMSFVGGEMTKEVARGIAKGEIDPISRLPMVDISRRDGGSPTRSPPRPFLTPSNGQSKLERSSTVPQKRPTPALAGGQTLLSFGSGQLTIQRRSTAPEERTPPGSTHSRISLGIRKSMDWRPSSAPQTPTTPTSAAPSAPAKPATTGSKRMASGLFRTDVATKRARTASKDEEEEEKENRDTFSAAWEERFSFKKTSTSVTTNPFTVAASHAYRRAHATALMAAGPGTEPRSSERSPAGRGLGAVGTPSPTADSGRVRRAHGSGGGGSKMPLAVAVSNAATPTRTAALRKGEVSPRTPSSLLEMFRFDR